LSGILFRIVYQKIVHSIEYSLSYATPYKVKQEFIGGLLRALLEKKNGAFSRRAATQQWRRNSMLSDSCFPTEEPKPVPPWGCCVV